LVKNKLACFTFASTFGGSCVMKKKKKQDKTMPKFIPKTTSGGRVESILFKYFGDSSVLERKFLHHEVVSKIWLSQRNNFFRK
jgi:hypothetical protein